MTRSARIAYSYVALISQRPPHEHGRRIRNRFSPPPRRDWPSIRQFNVFLANRLGAMMNLVRRFESSDVRIVSLTVVDSADCAIIRIVPSDPERAVEILEQGKLPFTESDLLVVQVPESRQPLVDICKTLLTRRSTFTTLIRCSASARWGFRRWRCTSMTTRQR